jgi:hypothetical protein
MAIQNIMSYSSAEKTELDEEGLSICGEIFALAFNSKQVAKKLYQYFLRKRIIDDEDTYATILF